MAIALPSRARMLQVLKLRSEIFQTPFNPDGLHLGDKYLREPLRGPKLIRYYPPEVTMNFINKMANTEFRDLEFEQGKAWYERRKDRGKERPEKKKNEKAKKKK